VRLTAHGKSTPRVRGGATCYRQRPWRANPGVFLQGEARIRKFFRIGPPFGPDGIEFDLTANDLLEDLDPGWLESRDRILESRSETLAA
jgi:hypothetical protein